MVTNGNFFADFCPEDFLKNFQTNNGNIYFVNKKNLLLTFKNGNKW